LDNKVLLLLMHGVTMKKGKKEVKLHTFYTLEVNGQLYRPVVLPRPYP